MLAVANNPISYKTCLSEARRQNREEDKDYDNHGELGEASVSDLSNNRVSVVDEWVTGESVKANSDQQKLLNIIATRMKEEVQDLMEGYAGNSEPLSLLCMGGPVLENHTYPKLRVDCST